MAVFNFTPTVGCFLLLVLGVYGVAGLIFNIRELATEKNFDRGSWPLNHRAGFVCLAFAQSGIIIAAIIGITAAYKKAILVFYISAFILLLVFASLVIIGGICLRDATKDLSRLIFTSLRNGNAEDFAWISYVQWEHNCCGVHSFMDWSMFNMTNSTLAKDSVPISCCQRTIVIPSEKCGDGVLKPSGRIQEIRNVINSEGCGEKLAVFHKQALNYAGIEMMVVGSICLAVAAFLYIGVTKIIYVDLNQDDLGPDMEGLDETNNNGCPPNSGDCNCRYGAGTQSGNNNGTNDVSAMPCMNPSFRPSQLIKHKDGSCANGNCSGRGQGGSGTTRPQYMQPFYQRKRSERYRYQKSKNQRQQGHPPVICGPSIPKEIVETSVLKNLEMLYNPANKHSTMSTTPHPSMSQNNQFEFSNPGETGNSGVNLASAVKNILAHHSSLPHVHPFPFSGIIPRNPKYSIPPLKFPPAAPRIPKVHVHGNVPPPEFSGTTIVVNNNEITQEVTYHNHQDQNDSNHESIPTFLSNTKFSNTMSQIRTKLDPIQEESGNRLKSLDSITSNVSEMSPSNAQSELQVRNSDSAVANSEKIFLKVEEENVEPGMGEVLEGAFGLENPGSGQNQAACLESIFENEIGKECGLRDEEKIDLEIPLGDSNCFCVQEL